MARPNATATPPRAPSARKARRKTHRRMTNDEIRRLTRQIAGRYGEEV